VLPDDLDARLDIDVRKLTYGDLELRDFKGSGRIRDQKLTLDGVRANALGGSMKLNGTLATPPKAPPTFDMVYVVDQVSFAQAFEALPSMRAYAPIARFLDGRFSTDLRASGTLGDDLSPKLDSIDADGLVAALQSTLSSSFEPLRVLSSALPAIPKPLGVESFKTRFAIKDGAVEVKPFTVNARGLAMQVSGTHGLDQEMKYRVSTEVPIDTLSSKLAAEVKGLGLNLAKVKTVGVRAQLTGSIQSPRVSVDLDTSALRGAVADVVSAKLAEQRARAMKEAEAQAQKLVAEAEKRAEQIRREAKKAAEKLRKEGYARADQVEREEAANPLTKIAAQESAKRIRRETDQRVDQMIREADRRADQAVTEARKRAEQAVEDAAKRSEQATEAAEKQTTRKLR
jgi:vacuolar-type H+-ATPase subunit H